MNFDPDIYRLFLAKRTQVEMMRDRGYEIPPEEEFFLNYSRYQLDEVGYNYFIEGYNDQESYFRDRLSQIYEHPDGYNIYVSFTEADDFRSAFKLTTELIRKFFARLKEEQTSQGMIISKGEFTKGGLNNFSNAQADNIEVFFDAQLYVNPAYHVLTPVHRLVEDRQGLLGKRNPIDPSRMVAISYQDPIVRYYGWTAGDIIEVIRKNFAADSMMVDATLSYRIVTMDHLLRKKEK